MRGKKGGSDWKSSGTLQGPICLSPVTTSDPHVLTKVLPGADHSLINLPELLEGQFILLEAPEWILTLVIWSGRII